MAKVRLKEQNDLILHFEVAKVRLKEQKDMILHFEAAKGRSKEQKDMILHFEAGKVRLKERRADNGAVLLTFVTKISDFANKESVLKCAPFVGRV